MGLQVSFINGELTRYVFSAPLSLSLSFIFIAQTRFFVETDDPTRLFCEVCTRHVVVCSSIEDIEYNVAQDHCVSFDPDIVRSPIYDQRKDLKDRLEKRKRRQERRECRQKKLQNQVQDEEGICQKGKEEEKEGGVFEEEEEDDGEDEDDGELDAVEARRRTIEELYDERRDKMPRNPRGLRIIKIGITGDDDRMTLNFSRTLFNSCKNQCPDSKFQVTSDG
jgi:hypothetical protein